HEGPHRPRHRWSNCAAPPRRRPPDARSVTVLVQMRRPRRVRRAPRRSPRRRPHTAARRRPHAAGGMRPVRVRRGPSSQGWTRSDLLDVLERFEAGPAAVQRLAGRGPEAGQFLGLGRPTPWAAWSSTSGQKDQWHGAVGTCRRPPGWGDAVLGEFAPSLLGDPVTRPGRGEFGTYFDPVEPGCAHGPVHIRTHLGQGGAPRVCGGDPDRDGAVLLDAYPAQDS